MKVQNSFFATTICLFLISFFSSTPVQSQNLYDREHSQQFATFLFQSGQYDLAAREYERITLLNESLHPPKNLFVAYRLANKVDIGLKRVDYFYPGLESLPRDVYLESGKMLLITERFEQYSTITASQTTLSPSEKGVFGNIRSIYDPSFEVDLSSIQMLGIENPNVIQIYQVLEDYGQEKFKSPLVAGLLSGVIPGSGKLYAGDWKNAIFSLLFVGINTYQSYRGFSRNGINSAQGWIFGGIGFGYYVGNIYGATWTAKRKNQQIRDEYKKKMDLYYFSM